jgi:hypothetical protein
MTLVIDWLSGGNVHLELITPLTNWDEPPSRYPKRSMFHVWNIMNMSPYEKKMTQYSVSQVNLIRWSRISKGNSCDWKTNL